MKIAYITPRFSPHAGGVERHVERLAAHACAAGAEVTVYTHDLERDLAADEWLGPVRVRRFRKAVPAAHLGFSPALARALRGAARGYDVVHAHSYHATPSLIAAHVRARRFVFTPHYHGVGHGPVRRALHGPYRTLGRRIFGAADAVICVSHAEASLVRRDFKAGRAPTVIPNGIDPVPATAAAPRAAGRPIVLYVGRLERYKGVDRLIDSIAETRGALALEVIGDGPDRARLARLAEGLDVAFLGSVSDTELDGARRAATVVANLSSNEAFGMTLAEAAAAGARVVASRIPAHEELFAGLPGALVDANTPPASLAEILLEQSRLGRVPPGSARFKTWDEVWSETSDLYRRIGAA
jgi:glycosyltransferase involved in cell wall biosynthesis